MGANIWKLKHKSATIFSHIIKKFCENSMYPITRRFENKYVDQSNGFQNNCRQQLQNVN